MSEPVLTTRPFVFTFAIFRRFYLATYFAGLFSPVLLVFQVLCFVGLPAWVNRYALAQGIWRPFATEVAVVLLIVYVLLPPALVFIAWNRIRKLPTMQGERTLAIAADKLTVKSPTTDLALDWSAVLRIRRVLGLIVFFTQKNAGIVAPQSAFATAADADAFLEQAQGFQAAARSATKSAAGAKTLDG